MKTKQKIIRTFRSKPYLFALPAVLIMFQLVFAPLLSVTQAATGWYNSGWAYRKKITVDGSQVGENLVRYPLRVDVGSDMDLAARAQSDFDDVVFTAADGVTKLDHEIVPAGSTKPKNIQQLDSNGAWCWFGDPRGLYHEGQYKRTYLGWLDSSGSVYVSSFDHTTRSSQKFKIRDKFQVDDHANPSLMMRSDGRLMVFYAAHVGSSMFYRISNNVEDISSWGPERTVPTNVAGSWGYTYPNPVQLSGENNRIYLFWRGANANPTFTTSGDQGNTWAQARNLFLVPGQRPYVKVVSNNVDEIHFSVTDGHPNVNPKNNIYHFYYKNGGFYKSDGTFIKSASQLPLTPSEVTKVYDANTGGSRGWNWDIALDDTGKPVMVYANFPSNSDHRYHYARWDGTAWRSNEVTRAGGYISDPSEVEYSGGIVLDGKNPNIVYLSRQIGSTWEIEKRITTDLGVTWTTESITSNSGAVKNVRPFVPRNHHDTELNVMWMSGTYPSYKTYDTAIHGYPGLDTKAAAAEAYVKVPSISSGSNTEIYMYYGNQSVSSQAAATQTWGSSYRSVHHMNNNASGSLTDSTANKLSATRTKPNHPVEIQSSLTKGQRYDGNTNVLTLGALNMANWKTLSAEAWFTYEKEHKPQKHTILSSWLNGGDILIRVDTTTNRLEAYVRGANKIQVGGQFPDLVVGDKPHYVAVTYDTTRGLRAYLDGRQSTTSFGQRGALDAAASSPIRIGTTPHNPIDSFRGTIDEVRISNSVRSPQWISATSTNTIAPQKLINFSAQESRL